MSKVILFGGKKRSGKDTVANITSEYLELKGYSVSTISFAQPIKEIIATLFDCSTRDVNFFKDNPNKVWIEVMNSDNLVLHQTDFRRLLQLLGTECRDKFFGKNVWVDIAKSNILASRSDYVLISDWRFPFEYESILGDFDTKSIIINRAINVIDSHPSEMALDNFVPDFSVSNLGTIDELKSKVYKVLDTLT